MAHKALGRAGGGVRDEWRMHIQSGCMYAGGLGDAGGLLGDDEQGTVKHAVLRAADNVAWGSVLTPCVNCVNTHECVVCIY